METPHPIEFEELAISAGACPVEILTGRLKQANARYFIGSGKLEEIAQLIQLHQAEIVLFDHPLSPSQERNLEEALKCRVIDRTGLILDIFAQRARSYEGKLQVELAQLQHSITRLVRGWTHLDRQKGGIGMRGAGETQLEIDQRLVNVRIKSIKKSLAKVKKQRDQGRRSRKRAEIPTISLVGYTNAGKSSLFNLMSESNIYVADQLFATLDSTLRKIQLPDLGSAILVDTVGFIRNLPHQLVDAFRATLEETTEASLLLHVIDASNEEHPLLKDQVDKVLEEIGGAEIPTLLVYNKIDLLENQEVTVDRDKDGIPWRVWVSAKTALGMTELFQAITDILGVDFVEPEIILSHQQGKFRAKLYHQNVVRKEAVDDEGNVCLSLRLPKADFIRLLQEEDIDPAPYLEQAHMDNDHTETIQNPTN
ncbi:MAG: GTP-binding protein HflX [Pseudohongiellaceae bacterium]|jgi:GTP-binding protein HflX